MGDVLHLSFVRHWDCGSRCFCRLLLRWCGYVEIFNVICVVSNAGTCDEYRRFEMKMGEANAREPNEEMVAAVVAAGAVVAVEMAEDRLERIAAQDNGDGGVHEKESDQALMVETNTLEDCQDLAAAQPSAPLTPPPSFYSSPRQMRRSTRLGSRPTLRKIPCCRGLSTTMITFATFLLLPPPPSQIRTTTPHS